MLPPTSTSQSGELGDVTSGMKLVQVHTSGSSRTGKKSQKVSTHNAAARISGSEQRLLGSFCTCALPGAPAPTDAEPPLRDLAATNCTIRRSRAGLRKHTCSCKQILYRPIVACRADLSRAAGRCIPSCQLASTTCSAKSPYPQKGPHAESRFMYSFIATPCIATRASRYANISVDEKRCFRCSVRAHGQQVECCLLQNVVISVSSSLPINSTPTIAKCWSTFRGQVAAPSPPSRGKTMMPLLLRGDKV